MQIASDELIGGHAVPNGGRRTPAADLLDDVAERCETVGPVLTTAAPLVEVGLRRPALEAAARALAEDVIGWVEDRTAELLAQAETTATMLLEDAETRARAATAEAEARVAAAEARLEELRELTASAEVVNAEAVLIRARAEDAAGDILEEAWRTAEALQEEMLQEAEDHVREMLHQAEQRASTQDHDSSSDLGGRRHPVGNGATALIVAPDGSVRVADEAAPGRLRRALRRWWTRGLN